MSTAIQSGTISTTAAQPLARVRVIEVSEATAAAFCGKLLADLGAQVRKYAVAPNGTTAVGMTSPYADAHKQLHHFPRGDVETATRLARELYEADVVLTDLDAGRWSGLGLPPLADLAGASVIAVELPTFGSTSANGRWRGGDLISQAFGGFCSMVGERNREPLMAPYGMLAFQHGLNAAGAVTAALIHRRTSGRGVRVEVAAVDVIAAYTRIYGLLYSFYNIDVRRDGKRAPGSGGRYPFGIFQCRDGYVVLIARSGADWRKFLNMMGNPSWSEQVRYRDLYSIAIEYPDEVDALVSPWLELHTREELLALAREFQVPMAPVRSIAEVLQDPQLHFRKFFEARDLEGRTVQMAGKPWVANGEAPAPNR